MRAVIQRVTSARVRVGPRVTGEIERGLLVLLGVGRGDTVADAQYIAGKIRDLRVFESDDGKPMDRSVVDVGGAVLVVSQFTLYGDVRKGRRPSFDDAAPPAGAIAAGRRRNARKRTMNGSSAGMASSGYGLKTVSAPTVACRQRKPTAARAAAPAANLSGMAQRMDR